MPVIALVICGVAGLLCKLFYDMGHDDGYQEARAVFSDIKADLQYHHVFKDIVREVRRRDPAAAAAIEKMWELPNPFRRDGEKAAGSPDG